jgi:hypothetical protein
MRLVGKNKTEPKIKIIGIAGKAGTGKSEVARILAEKGYAVVAFADVLKRILKEVFDFSDEQLWGGSQNRNAPDMRYVRPGKTDEYLTVRHSLQSLGTDWGRKCYDNVWVDYTMRVTDAILNPEEYSAKHDKITVQVNAYAPVYKYTEKKGVYMAGYKSAGDIIDGPIGVVLSDVRFMNEAQAIRYRGGKIFLVKRQTSLSGEAAKHESENGLPEEDSFYDGVIDNSGDLKQLKQIVSELLIQA